MNPRGLGMRHRRLLTWLCAAGWLVCFAATHTPQERLPSLGPSDKTLHVLGYASLAMLFWLALWAHGRRWAWRLALVGAVLAAYGAIDEITQPVVGRCASVLDWYADGVGIVVGVAVCESLATLGRRKTSDAP